MSKLVKNILIGAIAILLLYGAYSLLTGGVSDSTDQLLSSEKTTGADLVDNSLLSLLLELRSIELDGSIFNSPTFQALHDFGIEIKPQPVGKSNPFSSLDSSPSQNPSQE